MSEILREFVDSRGVAVRTDRAAGVIRGVKILGCASRNGRTYPPGTLLAAAPLYEGAKVNVNHPKTAAGTPRDYQDRIGAIRNVTVRAGEGLFADFYFNPKHALAEQLLWDAEHAPENVGFSHNVEARTTRRGEQIVVEAITRVQSVDLVADPATTHGLFESANAPALADAPLAEESLAEAAHKPDEDGRPPLWSEVTLEQLRRHRPDLVEALLAGPADHVEQLQEEIQSLRAAADRQARVFRLLHEAGLSVADAESAGSRAAVSPRFVELLLATAEESVVRELIDERARWARSSTGRGVAPQSREQTSEARSSPADAAAFVKAIT